MTDKYMFEDIRDEIVRVLFEKERIYKLKTIIDTYIGIDQLNGEMTSEEMDMMIEWREMCKFLVAYFEDKKTIMNEMKVRDKINWYLLELYEFIYVYNIEEVVESL